MGRRAGAASAGSPLVVVTGEVTGVGILVRGGGASGAPNAGEAGRVGPRWYDGLPPIGVRRRGVASGARSRPTGVERGGLPDGVRVGKLWMICGATAGVAATGGAADAGGDNGGFGPELSLTTNEARSTATGAGVVADGAAAVAGAACAGVAAASVPLSTATGAGRAGLGTYRGRVRRDRREAPAGSRLASSDR